MKVGKNIDYKVEKDKLVITIDLKQDFGTSKSGKNTIIASSEGNVSVEGAGGVKIGLNVYKPAA